MYSAGPRVEPQFLERVARLDDPCVPMAETYRRIRGLAAELGIPRPSYERVRLELRPGRTLEAHRSQARDLLLQLAYNTRPADAVIGDLLELLE